MSPQPDRSHEHTLFLDASPGDVWRAITEAEELVRWFPLGASTKPGPGGEIVYRWGELVGRCRILAWSPPKHLRTGWMEAPAKAPGKAPSSPLVVDWHLDGAGGGTTLRLVHSGFGRDASFDKEFDGTRRGWTFELQALRHYLERHRGRERHATWIRRVTDLEPAEVWERLARPGALLRAGTLEGLAAGDRYRLVRADGVELAGRVLVNHSPLEFAGTLESHGEAMLRLGFEDCMGAPEAHVWLATWGDRAAFQAEEHAWTAALDAALA